MSFHLKSFIASFKIIIHQNMIKKTWRFSLFKLSLSISKSFLDLFFGFCSSVDQIKKPFSQLTFLPLITRVKHVDKD